MFVIKLICTGRPHRSHLGTDQFLRIWVHSKVKALFLKEPDKPPKSDRLLIDIESRKKKRKKVSSEAAKSSSQSGSKSVSSGGSGADKLHTEDQRKIKRRRFYTSIMKREIGKAQKARNFNQASIFCSTVYCFVISLKYKRI